MNRPEKWGWGRRFNKSPEREPRFMKRVSQRRRNREAAGWPPDLHGHGEY